MITNVRSSAAFNVLDEQFSQSNVEKLIQQPNEWMLVGTDDNVAMNH